ncbi:Carnitinyl-CoA dehydratase [Paraconexibacter sp. AEG42_29]|uniref:3-hydroxyisobutyryl-CoA hydrolase n=1 Tax=Paraconexibacter sp. AEG42_29 TaxID=2997339 RepID=A0AAU7B028_9ACTN
MTDAERPVLVSTDGRLGRITLNRPRAINALTLEMIRLIDEALTAWEGDDAVACVLLDGAGERGLCAGGDVILMRDSALATDRTPVMDFWREEYRLNARIASYGKPIVAVLDGVVMGGGVGLAAHASHAVVTERVRFAMPEVGIGFTPDVGGTFLLSRAPGELGTHLALTGASVGAGDVLACGFARSFLAAEEVDEVAAALVTGADVPTVLTAASMRSGEIPGSTLEEGRDWIDECYAGDDAAQIVARLRERPETGAHAAADLVERQSPTSVAVTLAALRRAAALDSLEECLEHEWATSLAFLDTPDFVEGIRAAVVDKDRSPTWSPPALATVPQAEIARHLGPLPDGVPPLFG